MARPTTIGSFDRRITIQEEVITTNNYNEKRSTWIDKVTLPANVRSGSGYESYQADQLTAVLTTSFLIRYRRDIDVKMRIVYEGSVYGIVSITEPNETRRQYLELKGELVAEE